MNKLFEFLSRNAMSLVLSIVGFVATVKGIIDSVNNIKKKSFTRKRTFLVIAYALVALLCFFYVWEQYRSFVYVEVTVDKVELSMTEANLYITEEDELKRHTQLQAVVRYTDGTYDNNVQWSSANSEIAEVDEKGNVTAMGRGTTKITAYASKNNVTRDAECIIHVIESPKGYSISLGAKDVMLGEEFSVQVLPDDDTVSEIYIIGESPTGEKFEVPLGEKKFQIYSECGSWKIYAKIVNGAGEYVGKKEEEVKIINVTKWGW